MKKSILLLLLTVYAFLTGSSQYWQQQVDYRIDVTLNDKDHTLDGFEKITYTNNSSDTLTYIWFHLWPNAYKNDQTAFSDQRLENGDTRFYFASKEERGYINRLDFKVNGQSAKTEDHPNHIDIIKLLLPAPLNPSAQITITTPFHIKLPYNFSRGGHDGQSYQATQWYPKPAVYDKKGWHPMPYLDQGEFYSEFGNFDVRITVPKNYVVAATGHLQNEEEEKWLRNKTAENESSEQEPRDKAVPTKKLKTTTEKPAPKKASTISKTKVITKENTVKEPVIVETKTLQFIQNNVHDFAWFANKSFLVKQDTCILPSGKIIEAYTYFTAKEQKVWKSSIQFVKDAVRFYSTEVGEYPYNTVSAVQGPQSFGGGMEYPTITLIAPVTNEKSLDIVLTHEIGHNWFYGILASNERTYPWMDEGINSFYEQKYTAAKYGSAGKEADLFYKTKAVQKTDQPIQTTSEDFSLTNYAAIAYHKTAKWLQLIEDTLGKEVFQSAMQSYYNQWKYKHPQPVDFKNALTPYLKSKTENFFSLLSVKGELPERKNNSWKIATPFTLNKYIQQPTKNLLLISPAIGVNSYDKFMIGAMLTNYNLPPAKFQFLTIPLYSTGAKQLNGLGRLSYSVYSEKKIRRTELFLNGSVFSMNEFTDSSGTKHIARFQKLVPGIKISFKEKDPRSTVRKSLVWKTFFIREGGFRFGTDTIINPIDTTLKQTIRIKNENQVVNRLQFDYGNTRALYPFNFQVTIDQIKDLIRPSITANYIFNYAKNGGLEVRLFAGKLFYLEGRDQLKSFSTERYHLNMSGADGYEDYTYSNYFTGRNRFEGLSSQQIMIRDGGFKFRTDLLGNEIGKTDKWLAALNFSSTIPPKFNPLSILPVKLPLRVFADIGTYGDAWEKNSESDHFLFDAGLQLSLLNEAINIYMPVFYSKVYRDYYKSYLSEKRFLKTISFSIQLNTPVIKKVTNEVDF